MVVLSNYRHVCGGGLLNLPWMQVRRIASAIHLIFIGFWKGEMLIGEAERAVDDCLVLMSILSTRWNAAREVADTVKLLADKSNLNYREPTPPAEAAPVRPFDATIHNTTVDLTMLSDLATSSVITGNGAHALPDSPLPSDFGVLNGFNWFGSLGQSLDGPVWMGAGEGNYDYTSGWDRLLGAGFPNS